MRVEVFFTPHQIDEMSLRDKTVVVIDVLRASTTIATALHNGAKEVIPATTVEAAMKIVGNLSGDVTLLGGERGGKMIEGFHLGNSPREYITERVKGKSIVYTTTNGSQAIVKARHSKEMLVCGFVNISTVQSSLSESGRDVVILCSGNNGGFSLEDAVCAGMVIQKLTDAAGGDAIEHDDAGSASLALYEQHGGSLRAMLKKSTHGKYLEEIGFGDDLSICADVDAVPELPLLVSTVIKLKKDVAEKVSLSQ